jgi:hypothetical protein
MSLQYIRGFKVKEDSRRIPYFQCSVSKSNERTYSWKRILQIYLQVIRSRSYVCELASFVRLHPDVFDPVGSGSIHMVPYIVERLVYGLRFYVARIF